MTSSVALGHHRVTRRHLTAAGGIVLSVPSQDRAAPRGPPLAAPHLRVGIGCLVAVPVATWFLLGDMSEPDGMDRMYSVPEVPRPVEIFLAPWRRGA